MLRRTFLLALLALPGCAANSVVWRRRSEDGLPHDAPLFLWPVQSAETAHRDPSIDALEKHLIAMAERDGVVLRTDSAPPSDAWSILIRVSGLPIRPSEPFLIPSNSVDATAVVVIRRGESVTDVIEVTEEIRRYYVDYLPWRLARKIADLIAQRRNGW